MTPKRPGYAIVFLLLAETAVLYLLAKSNLSIIISRPFLSIAQISALLGAVLFSLSFVLATRFQVVEEAFGGLDRAYRAHHRLGVWAFSFLAAHFLALVINSADVFNAIFVWLIPTYIYGAIALVLLAAIATTIIFAHIPYRAFVIIQKFFAIPMAIGILHLFTVTSDVSRYRPLGVWIAAFMFAGMIAWLYREVLYYLIASKAFYTVKEKHDLGSDITEFALSPEKSNLKFSPGQFGYFSFSSKAVSKEAHPFSFTSPPNETNLRFSAKGVGDYTDALKNTAIGDRVCVHGSYGRFFSDFNAADKNVLIAGGIGITPFLSLVRSDEKFPKTIFFYCVNSMLNAVYDAELKKLSENGDVFKYFIHESDRRGHITADIIEKHCNGVKDKKFYICGPTMMMNGISNGLKIKGVRPDDIHFESFNY
jgi:Predicted ferric reductase